MEFKSELSSWEESIRTAEERKGNETWAKELKDLNDWPEIEKRLENYKDISHILVERAILEMEDKEEIRNYIVKHLELSGDRYFKDVLFKSVTLSRGRESYTEPQRRAWVIQIYALNKDLIFSERIFEFCKIPCPGDLIEAIVEQGFPITEDHVFKEGEIDVFGMAFKGTESHWNGLLRGLTPKYGTTIIERADMEEGVELNINKDYNDLDLEQWKAVLKRFPETMKNKREAFKATKLDIGLTLIKEGLIPNWKKVSLMHYKSKHLDKLSEVIIPAINDPVDEEGNTMLHLSNYISTSNSFLTEDRNRIEPEQLKIEWLIKNGADLSIKNKKGKTPVEEIMGRKYKLHMLFSGMGS